MWTYAIKQDGEWGMVPEDFSDPNECEKRAFERWKITDIEDFLILQFHDDDEYWELVEKVENLNSEDDELVADDMFWLLVHDSGDKKRNHENMDS